MNCLLNSSFCIGGVLQTEGIRFGMMKRNGKWLRKVQVHLFIVGGQSVIFQKLRDPIEISFGVNVES